MNDILVNADVQDHRIEHEFESIRDNIKNLIGKLEKKEKESEDRIEILEDMIKKVLSCRIVFFSCFSFFFQFSDRVLLSRKLKDRCHPACAFWRIK